MFIHYQDIVTSAKNDTLMTFTSQSMNRQTIVRANICTAVVIVDIVVVWVSLQNIGEKFAEVSCSLVS